MMEMHYTKLFLIPSLSENHVRSYCTENNKRSKFVGRHNQVLS